MEAVLSLRAAQTQSLGWMEHHQREAAANKGAIEQVRADQERGLAGAAEAAHAVRQQWEREVAALDARLADVVKALERQHGERAALQATNAAVDALRREMSDARRVDQLAVRRLKEVVESRSLMPPPEPRPPRAMTHVRAAARRRRRPTRGALRSSRRRVRRQSPQRRRAVRVDPAASSARVASRARGRSCTRRGRRTGGSYNLKCISMQSSAPLPPPLASLQNAAAVCGRRKSRRSGGWNQ